jgi:hypothetical protein
VSFAAIALYVAYKRVSVVVAAAAAYFVMTQSEDFWIHLHTCMLNFTVSSGFAGSDVFNRVRNTES